MSIFSRWVCKVRALICIGVTSYIKWWKPYKNFSSGLDENDSQTFLEAQMVVQICSLPVDGTSGTLTVARGEDTLQFRVWEGKPNSPICQVACGSGILKHQPPNHCLPCAVGLASLRSLTELPSRLSQAGYYGDSLLSWQGNLTVCIVHE